MPGEIFELVVSSCIPGAFIWLLLTSRALRRAALLIKVGCGTAPPTGGDVRALGLLSENQTLRAAMRAWVLRDPRVAAAHMRRHHWGGLVRGGDLCFVRWMWHAHEPSRRVISACVGCAKPPPPCAAALRAYIRRARLRRVAVTKSRISASAASMYGTILSH